MNKNKIMIVKINKSLLNIVSSSLGGLANVAEVAIIILAMTFNMINIQK
jgi:hypothetical protein